MCEVRVVRVVNVVIKGREGDYWAWTLHQWVLEIKPVIEYEYGVQLSVDFINEDLEVPTIYVDGNAVCEGVPGEEGYLIEVLKSFLDRYLGE